MNTLAEKTTPQIAAVNELLDQVTDPEIPVISIRELGILRDVHLDLSTVVIVITPTYSGCPAMRHIRQDVEALLNKHGYTDHRVELKLAPAWTTDWMSEDGAQKLRDYGIAPPVARNKGTVNCPNCRSENTQLVSEFGSTACKSLFKCLQCLEPFDYFKCI